MMFRIGSSLAAILAMIYVFLCFRYPLGDGDIWWHLATGRWIMENAKIPRFDPFCTASFGDPWIDLHWGYQIFSWIFFQLGGLSLLIHIKAIFMAVTVLLAPLFFNRGPALFASLFFAGICAFDMRHLVDVRPIVLTMVLLAFIWLLLNEFLTGKIDKAIWIIIPIQLILTNVQGLFPLGWALVGSAALGSLYPKAGVSKSKILKLWALTLFVMIISLANPYFWEGFFLPFELFGRITPVSNNVWSVEIAENVPLFRLWETHPNRVLGPAWITFFLIISFYYSKRETRAFYWLMILGFGFLAVSALRNIPLYYLIAIFVFSGNMRGFSLSVSSRIKKFYFSTSVVLVGVMLIISFQGIWASQKIMHKGVEIAPLRYPTKARNYLQQHPFKGKLFNELRYGGYLSFYPLSKKPFVDTRMIIRTTGFFSELLGVLDNPARFPRYAIEHDFGAVILPVSEFSRALPLAAFLLRHPDWELKFSDGVSVIFYKSDRKSGVSHDKVHPDELESINHAIYSRFSQNNKWEELARTNVCRMFFTAALPDAMISLLKGHHGELANVARARALLLKGNREEGKKLLLINLEEYPESSVTKQTLSELAWSEGHFELAKKLSSQVGSQRLENWIPPPRHYLEP